jgi:hypothetical protein
VCEEHRLQDRARWEESENEDERMVEHARRDDDRHWRGRRRRSATDDERDEFSAFGQS